MAIETHPRLPDGSPFPTLFWLTCPILVKRAAGLEGDGWMKELNLSLAEDTGLRDRMVVSLEAYRARRDQHDVIDDRGSPPGGGPDRVKCLHAHLAHELVTNANPVGARTLGAAGFPDCRTPCFSVS